MSKVVHTAFLFGLMVCLTTVAVHASHPSALKKLLVPDNIRYLYDHESMHNHHHHSSHSKESSSDSPTECCSSIRRTITPLGGLSRDGRLLQLYRSGDTIQKFKEVICAKNVENTPCDFIDQSEWVSVCEQETSYTYAIAKEFDKTENYRIDYIKINSGCSCKIIGPASP